MYMVFDASNLDRLETMIARNSRHVSPDTRLDFPGDAPATFFRAENDVDAIAGVGMRHRVVPPGLGLLLARLPSAEAVGQAGLCLRHLNWAMPSHRCSNQEYSGTRRTLRDCSHTREG